MKDKTRYPILEIDIEKFEHNAREVLSRCARRGISVAGVIKGFSAYPELSAAFVRCGTAQLASSRLRQLKEVRDAGIPGPYLLLRIPMLSELDRLVELADYSLQSDPATLRALQEECLRQNKKHKVILMADLGDLREGFWDKDEMVDVCAEVEQELSMVELAGVGTNLGCYGAIQPTPEKMHELLAVARRVEARIGRKLEIVSGGATSAYTLVHWGTVPEGINHLRIGEGISLAYDLPVDWEIKDMDYLYQDVYTLKAQVIEVREKPSYPQGVSRIDAFGNKPVFEDRGIRKRALIAIGRADLAEIPKLMPRAKGIQVLGGSSDHTILDIEEYPGTLSPGDILEFDLNYTTQVFLTASPDVTKRLIR
ncbi:MAG TPA: alanine/ornithine racemase family PLP-dependent enzyme [Bacillota bacterium]|nr:alanine/ornithine racemase family PLP-dependent enzyme [Bacillota bacterium]